MTSAFAEDYARVLERYRLAPGLNRVAFQLGGRLRYPERVVFMARSRFNRILDRISRRRSSPLDDAETEALLERCLASLNERLVSFLQEIDPTMEARIARRILRLPEHKRVRPSVIRKLAA